MQVCARASQRWHRVTSWPPAMSRCTRARLTALYGDKGYLTLVPNPEGGVIASIELPCEISALGLAVA